MDINQLKLKINKKQIAKWVGITVLLVFIFGLALNLVYLNSLKTMPSEFEATGKIFDYKYKPITTFNEYVGGYHIHTNYSDGSGTFDELKTAAKGMDFIITTDHNTLNPRLDGKSGVYDGLTILTEMEISSPDGGGHFTSLDFHNFAGIQKGDEFNDYLPNEKLFNGNLNILAHPFHPKNGMQWVDYTQRFDGIEVWNYDVMWRNNLKSFTGVFSIINALIWSDSYPWTVQGGVFYPKTEFGFADTSSKQGLLLFAATDVHAKIKFTDNYFWRLPDYATMLPVMTLHLFTENYLNSDIAHNSETIYSTLRAGEFFLANDQLSPANGFRSLWKVRDQWYSKNVLFTENDTAVWRVQIPKMESEIIVRFVHNGQVYKQVENKFEIEQTITKPGYYRCEVFQKRFTPLFFYYESDQPWIFTQRYEIKM